MRYKAIQSSLFTRNRAKLFGLLDEDSLVILHSNDQMVRCGDQYYPYRQNSDFFYLTGIEQEMSILLLCPDHKERSRTAQLFIRKPDPKLEIWEGPKLTLEEAGKISGIESVHWLENFESITHEIIDVKTNIYYRTWEQEKFRPEYPSRDERYLNSLKEKYPSHKYKNLTPLLWQLRSKKEPEEVEMIKEAIRITALGFQKVLSMVKEGLKEFEIEAVLTREFIRMGASGQAYQPIIASGENG
jgi:Xaa-Pro aminopeptidase